MKERTVVLMSLKPDEAEALITAITDKLGENAPTVSDELAQLRSGYSGIYTEKSDLEKTNEQLANDKEQLILTNGKLFNQIKENDPLVKTTQHSGSDGDGGDPDTDPLEHMLDNVKESGDF
jgi:hypothetical protein